MINRVMSVANALNDIGLVSMPFFGRKGRKGSMSDEGLEDVAAKPAKKKTNGGGVGKLVMAGVVGCVAGIGAYTLYKKVRAL